MASNLFDHLKISCIHTLLNSEEFMLQFLLHHKHYGLRLPARKLLIEAKDLNKEDRLLTRIAIDIWNGKGSVWLTEVLDDMDDENFIRFIKALLQYREIYLDRFMEESC